MYIPLIDLANEEVNHLDVANSNGNNEVGNNFEDNPSFVDLPMQIQRTWILWILKGNDAVQK
jgi:hypothetical protein